jgi:hypothetical protein
MLAGFAPCLAAGYQAQNLAFGSMDNIIPAAAILLFVRKLTKVLGL